MSYQKRLVKSVFIGEKASETVFKEQASQSNILHIATHGYFYPDPDKVDEEFKSNDDEGELKFRGATNGYALWTFVKNKNPLMRSGLVLSGANDVWLNRNHESENDGVLTAHEVASINMRNTDLVVLSACETGLGDIKGSEGVYGLQRSFKMAGVKYIIMSLWRVPDQETSEFMKIFYKYLIKTSDVQKSFIKTQRTMLKKYDPYYWAAFILLS